MTIFDGSTLYDVLIVGYTHCLLGLSIFFIGFYIVKKFKLNILFNFINMLDNISYEIYLVHYMFIGGPVSVLFTNNILINFCLVILFTLLVAFILNRLCSIIQNKIFRTKVYIK